jgi:glyoxylase-like metal-dependent hydrolase (beta-lactamase superfamily II)
VRALGLHPDVVVATSLYWQTTCTAVRHGDEAFLIDSPVFPEELEALPALLGQAGFAIKGLLATHADWDHLLGRQAFPEAPLGCGETTAARLRAEPGAAQRELRNFDDENYVVRAPLSLPAAQALPVPGHCELGGQEIELHPADGHTADGTAYWLGWTGVLVVGDYLSPVEIPWISASGSLDAYSATLARLAPLVEQAAHVVPGHGSPQPRDAALAILAEDAAYLDALRDRGAQAPLPPRVGSSKAQGSIHAENVSRTAG